jgi:DNA-binding PucR family transcriptional regulator
MMHDMVQSAPAVSWPEVSPRVRELLRRGAELVLDPRAEWVNELHQASLSGERMRPVADDPVLAEGTRRTNLANLMHWASSNVQRPGRRVPANLGPEALEAARDLVRRGLDESALDAYRTAQQVAWRRWMEICFELTDDPAELRELLDVSSLSIGTFIDDTVAAVSAQMEAERHELTRGTTGERRAAVTLLIEGAPIARARAEAQLGYRLSGPHTAAIVWGGVDVDLDQLEAAAEVLMRSAGAAQRLTVVASAAALWVWLPVPASPAMEDLTAPLGGHPGVRVALGRPGRDLAGFRRSHLDAATTQRMLAALTSPQQVARYEDVQLVALLTTDRAASEEFVAATLGELADAAVDIVETVRTYVREQCNAARAAERLYTHRNTVLRRLARADELLPRPLADNLVSVAAALDVLHWRGRES